MFQIKVAEIAKDRWLWEVIIEGEFTNVKHKSFPEFISAKEAYADAMATWGFILDGRTF